MIILRDKWFDIPWVPTPVSPWRWGRNGVPIKGAKASSPNPHCEPGGRRKQVPIASRGIPPSPMIRTNHLDQPKHGVQRIWPVLRGTQPAFLERPPMPLPCRPSMSRFHGFQAHTAIRHCTYLPTIDVHTIVEHPNQEGGT